MVYPALKIFNQKVPEEARDAVQTLSVGQGYIMTAAGSVDEHVRTYDLRMGQLRTDYIGCQWNSPTIYFRN